MYRENGVRCTGNKAFPFFNYKHIVAKVAFGITVNQSFHANDENYAHPSESNSNESSRMNDEIRTGSKSRRNHSDKYNFPYTLYLDMSDNREFIMRNPVLHPLSKRVCANIVLKL